MTAKRMVITSKRIELLQTTLAGHRVLPYHAALTATCFDFGIFLAHTKADLPDWLSTAPRWALTAVVVGRSATLRAIEEDRLLTLTPAALAPVSDVEPDLAAGSPPSIPHAALVQRVSDWYGRLGTRPGSYSAVACWR